MARVRNGEVPLAHRKLLLANVRARWFSRSDARLSAKRSERYEQPMVSRQMPLRAIKFLRQLEEAFNDEALPFIAPID